MRDSGAEDLTFAAVQQILTAVDPSVVLASPRLLRRIIKHDRQLPGLGFRVPHADSHVIGRDRLLALADRSELGLPPERAIPDTVILLRRPGSKELRCRSRADLLRRYHRLLFHARIHVDLAVRSGLLATGTAAASHDLSPAQFRSRIRRIGLVEFEEVRRVLQQEKALLPSADDGAVYVEFAAAWLEFRCFDPSCLPLWFPGIESGSQVDEVLAADVDHARLLEATRLPGAADPAGDDWSAPEDGNQQADAGENTAAADEPAKPRFDRLRRGAVAAAGRGNRVRSALLCAAAARTARGGHAAGALAEARKHLGHLVDRLRQALELDDQEEAAWQELLPALLRPAASGFWPAEARLLYDLQKVCVDHEREVHRLDLVDWACSWGRRPIRRPLPGQGIVRALAHLRTALGRLPVIRIDPARRRSLAQRLQHAIHHEEYRLRERFRPIVSGVLDEVGLVPDNLPEQVARLKLVEELLDRIAEYGFLTMGDLRDALARNQRKLEDVSGPGELVQGDALLRCNDLFADRLDGVWHRGEIYLRLLQQMSALAFGTARGRWLTLHVALPFGGSCVILKGLEEIVHVAVGFLNMLGDAPAAVVGSSEQGDAGPHAEPIHLMTPWSFTLLGMFLLALIAWPGFRRAVGRTLAAAWGALHWVGVALPAAVWNSPVVQQILGSQLFALCNQLLFKPVILTVPVLAILSLGGATFPITVGGAGTMFLLATVLLNSRTGRAVEEVVVDRLVHVWDAIHIGIVPALLRLIIDVFKHLMEGIERLLYTVDEWLRFRTGETRLSFIVKLILGVFWFVITYLVRIFINLFAEPTFNPIKHFPVVTVAAKLIVPIIPMLGESITMALQPVIGIAGGGLVAGFVIFFLPGLAGFLVWELKENWRLYRANRAATLRPIIVGSHGETVARLLRPGIHSGTIPRLFARLRRDRQRAAADGGWRPFRKHRDALVHVEEAMYRLVDRELLHLLRLSPSWGIPEVSVGTIRLATNSIRVELTRPGATSAWVEFSEQAGWLVAGLTEHGWIADLGMAQREIFSTALAGLYRLAGTDLLGDELDRLFDGRYLVREQGLVVWTGRDCALEAVYHLDAGPEIHPDPALEGLPVLEAARIFPHDRPIRWDDWVETWKHGLQSAVSLALQNNPGQP
jgi:hypothetical protein